MVWLTGNILNEIIDRDSPKYSIREYTRRPLTQDIIEMDIVFEDIVTGQLYFINIPDEDEHFYNDECIECVEVFEEEVMRPKTLFVTDDNTIMMSKW